MHCFVIIIIIVLCVIIHFIAIILLSLYYLLLHSHHCHCCCVSLSNFCINIGVIYLGVMARCHQEATMVGDGLKAFLCERQ